MLRWLKGVNSFDGRPATEALAATGPVHSTSKFESWVSTRKIPVGDSITQFVEYTKQNARGVFDGISLTLGGSIAAVDGLLRGIPAPVLIGGIALLAWVLRRSVGLAVFIVASLLFIMNQGYWIATLETLSLVLVAALIATLIGVRIGIAAAKRPRLYAAMRPVLDLMQTLPTFVYLTPTLVLFGLGVVPGLDFHDHLRTPGADPADATRYRVGAERPDQLGDFRGLVAMVGSRPCREVPAGLFRHCDPKPGVVGERDRVEPGGYLSGQRHEILFTASVRVLLGANGSSVLVRSLPIDRAVRNAQQLQPRLGAFA